jgi:hypothetical protein
MVPPLFSNDKNCTYKVKAYGEVEVEPHPFFTIEIEVSDQFHAIPLYCPEKYVYALIRRLIWLHNRSKQLEEMKAFLALPRIERRFLSLSHLSLVTMSTSVWSLY